MTLKERFLGNIRGDLFGGVTAGIVALPLALGFGVASGMENGAAAGMYGAIAVGLFAALFGGTPSQISGPTGPMTVVVAGLVGGLTGDPRWIFVAVVLAGAMQILFGLLRVGRYINYVPYPVVSGFMSGIGVIIIILQMAQLVGHRPARGTVLAIQRLPEDFTNVNFSALLLGLATIAIIYLSPRLTKLVPGTLIGLLIVTTASVLFSLDVPRIGDIPRGLPSFNLPEFEFAQFKLIIFPALMLAVVGSLDSLLTSLVADAMTKTRHGSERELVGQGIGNMVAGVFGGLPGAGATMRTVVNVKSGGRLHLSGVVHAVLLLAILLVLGPMAEAIPMAVLAGILITVGIGIIDVKGLRHTVHAPRGDVAVMLTVMGVTVFFDLMLAVGIGMVMAAMILLKRLSDIDPATHSPLIDIAAHRPWIPPLEVPEEVLHGIFVVEVHGSLFFGNAGPLQRKIEGADLHDAKAVILHMGDVRLVDQSGVYVLGDLASDLQNRGIEVFLADLQDEPKELLAKLGVAPGVIPENRLFDRSWDAIAAAADESHRGELNRAKASLRGRAGAV
ncbi:MAG: SulP family inorganic anion transporter [Planctomycetota bacterium]|jgi:SulP family sulfate permease